MSYYKFLTRIPQHDPTKQNISIKTNKTPVEPESCSPDSSSARTAFKIDSRYTRKK